MKRILALFFTFLMFTAFASVNKDYGGGNEQKVEYTQKQVVDDSSEVNLVMVLNNHHTEEAPGEVNTLQKVQTFNLAEKTTNPFERKGEFRRTDYEIRCNQQVDKI